MFFLLYIFFIHVPTAQVLTDEFVDVKQVTVDFFHPGLFLMCTVFFMTGGESGLAKEQHGVKLSIRILILT